MDFFEAQARARRRTGRLVVLFALAVAGTIAALYLAFVAGTAWMHLRATAGGGGVEYDSHTRGLGAIDWWQPGALKVITVLVLPTVAFSALFKWLQLRSGGPAVAEMVGGRRVEPDTQDLRERTLLNVVEEMALASGVAVPAVYLLPDEPALNAFAAGYSPADAAIAVTEGTLGRLDRDELQAVIAHEFSHILNGDMRLNTRLSALVFGILSIFVLGRTILHALSRTGSSGSSRREGKGSGAFFFVALALLIIGYFGHLFARLIQAAVSRQREFLADAAAVQFTRNPSGLADALKKVGGSAFQGRLNAPEAAEISHFCFVQNFGSGLIGLFATHPPLVERIRAIDPAFDGTFAPLPPLPQPEHVPYPAAHASIPPLVPRSGAARIDPAALIATAGQLSPAAVQAGRALLDSLTSPLREAAHDPARVAALCYALSLPQPAEPGALEPLLALITARGGSAAARQAGELYAALESLPPGHRLGLLQVAMPTLRHLDPAACATLLDTLDALVHADGVVTPHEFALQKILSRTLGLAARPRDALHVLAPSQVSSELSLALSVAARLDAANAPAAAQAFARAAMGFNGLQPPLAYQPGEPLTFEQLDPALDRLALTPAPFRKRILTALAEAFTADSRLTLAEADLLRAFAAALDCPLPPVPPISA